MVQVATALLLTHTRTLQPALLKLVTVKEVLFGRQTLSSLAAVAVAVEPLLTTLPKGQGLMAAVAAQVRVAVQLLATAAVQTTPI